MSFSKLSLILNLLVNTMPLFFSFWNSKIEDELFEDKTALNLLYVQVTECISKKVEYSLNTMLPYTVYIVMVLKGVVLLGGQ